MEQNQSFKAVTFRTSDGVTISADYYSGSNGSAVVLAHMFGRDRGVWDILPLKLKEKGLSVLNIDLRGHGQSTVQNGHQINAELFSEEDFAKMPLDLEAAKKFLVTAGANSEQISFIGASIGANAALVAASQDPRVKSVVLLSPGENYHGVKTFEAAKIYTTRPALIISSKEDTQSYGPSLQLASSIGSAADFIGLSNAGHGTALLSEQIDKQILSFIN